LPSHSTAANSIILTHIHAITGSQGSDSEADGCFGKLQAQSIDVVKRMQTQPGANKPMGFVNNPANHIKIVSVRLLR
jgi:hypothetical protein